MLRETAFWISPPLLMPKADTSEPGHSAWHISSAPSRPPGELASGKKNPSQLRTQTV